MTHPGAHNQPRWPHPEGFPGADNVPTTEFPAVQLPESFSGGRGVVPPESATEITTRIPRLDAHGRVAVHGAVEDSSPNEAVQWPGQEGELSTDAEAVWPDETVVAAISAAEATEAARQRDRNNPDEVLAAVRNNPDDHGYTAGEIGNAQRKIEIRMRRLRRQEQEAAAAEAAAAAEQERLAAEAAAIAERNRQARIGGVVRSMREAQDAASAGGTSVQEAGRAQIRTLLEHLPDDDVMAAILEEHPDLFVHANVHEIVSGANIAYAELKTYTLPAKVEKDEAGDKPRRKLLGRKKKDREPEELAEDEQAEGAEAEAVTLGDASLEEVLVDKDRWMGALGERFAARTSPELRQLAWDAMMLDKLRDVRNTGSNQQIIKAAKKLFVSSAGKYNYNAYKDALSRKGLVEEDYRAEIEEQAADGGYPRGVEDYRIINAKQEFFDGLAEEDLVEYYRNGAAANMDEQMRAAFEISLAERLSRQQLTGDGAVIKRTSEGLLDGINTLEGQQAFAARFADFRAIDAINNAKTVADLDKINYDYVTQEVQAAYEARLRALERPRRT